MTKTMSFLAALVVSVLALAVGAAPLQAQTREARFALVIGNDGYAAPLPTAANDAGLIADTLSSAGFDVTGARNLDLPTLRAALKEFVDKVAAAGPGSVALIYLSGVGVQFDGENYFLPLGAETGQATDVPNTAVSFAEIRASLGVLPVKARIVIFDAAHASPFSASTEPSAGGLALIEPTDGELVAFNAAPGTIAPTDQPPYGVYATALAEMIRTGGLPLAEVFERVRLRVVDVTHGNVVPFHLSRVKQTFQFFALGPTAPRPQALPHRKVSAAEAYSAAIARDTLAGYLEYLSAFPDSPPAPRIRAILAARREALTWLRSASLDTPEGYWSYLRRYPRGPHRYDARRRLAQLSAELAPPSDFDAIDYGDLPPPPPAEYTYLERHPYVSFEDEDFAPPPPMPEDDLPPPPVWWEPPPPPPPVFAPFFLPTPRPFTSPAYLAPPRYVTRPPPPPIYVQAPPSAPNGGAAVVAGGIAGAAAAAVMFQLPSVVQGRIQHDHQIFVTKAPVPGAGQPPLVPGQAIPGVPGVAKGIPAPGRPAPATPAAQTAPVATPVPPAQPPAQQPSTNGPQPSPPLPNHEPRPGLPKPLEPLPTGPRPIPGAQPLPAPAERPAAPPSAAPPRTAPPSVALPSATPPRAAPPSVALPSAAPPRAAPPPVALPSAAPPRAAPPAAAPPRAAPPVAAPPRAAPPAAAPPRAAPPAAAPPRAAPPAAAPPRAAPPAAAPPRAAPPAAAPPRAAPPPAAPPRPAPPPPAPAKAAPPPPASKPERKDCGHPGQPACR